MEESFRTNFTYNDLPLVSLVDSEIAGMAWARFNSPKDHIVHLYQMWVSPDFRGIGVARRLLDTALQWASLHGANCVRLGVTCGDTPARRLYDSTGFVPIGEPEPLHPESELLIQNMEFELSDAGI